MTEREALALVGEGRAAELRPDTINDLSHRGLIEWDDEMWWLTDDGWNELIPEFVP